jgi:hypothetical protein
MQYDWGPHYIVPSKALTDYGGCVVLRETYDEELLRKQLNERRLSAAQLLKITNLWFYRKKNDGEWTKIGESDNIKGNFAVRWDTTTLANGPYEIIGFMQAFVRQETPTKYQQITLSRGEFESFGYRPVLVKKHLEKRVIGGQNITEINIKN